MNFSPIQNVLSSAFRYAENQMLDELSIQQKRVALVALAALSLLTTACLIYRCFFAKKLDSETDDQLKKSPFPSNKQEKLSPKEKQDQDIQEKDSLDPEIQNSEVDVATSPSKVSKVQAEPSAFDATIPVVDMADFQHTDPIRRQKFIDELSKALKEVGFVAVLNPGVDQKALDDAYQAAEKFFRLSHDEKMKMNDLANGNQRGYVPGESAKGEKVGDFKEFYHVGREMTDEQAQRLGYCPNVWPQGMDLKNPLIDLFKALQGHMIPLQQAMASAIGQPEDFFTSMTEEGDLLLRAIHYPANPPDNQQWAAEHTDIDLFTILPRATADGLQVKNKEGQWIDVKVPDNAFIINAGDMLENITNGEFTSGLHRVMANGENKERFSMVLFIHPRSNDPLDPLPQCVERTGGVQKYALATRWELLEERLVDLGLASPAMIEDLAQCGLMERLIDVGRASPKAIDKIVEAGFANEVILGEWKKNQASESVKINSPSKTQRE